jgi:hypothetical protein
MLGHEGPPLLLIDQRRCSSSEIVDRHARRIFQDLVNTAASVILSAHEVTVPMRESTHDPLLIDAGYHNTEIPLPWLGGKHLRFDFGS